MADDPKASKTEEEMLRDNKHKIRVDLIDTTAIEDLAKVMTIGAQKYAPNNWRRAVDGTAQEWLEKTVASLERHVLAIKKACQRGSTYEGHFDEESGLPHAAHALANCMFLDWYVREKQRREELDDGLE